MGPVLVAGVESQLKLSSPGFPAPFPGLDPLFWVSNYCKLQILHFFCSWGDKSFFFSSLSDPWACERPYMLYEKLNQCDVLSSFLFPLPLPLIFGVDFAEGWKYLLPHIFFIFLLSPAPQNTLMMFLPSPLPLTAIFCDKSYSCTQHAKFCRYFK